MPPPPRSDADGAPSPDRGQVLVDRLAELQGVINVAHGAMVTLVAEGIALGEPGLGGLSSTDWVALRTGTAPERAADLVRVAERVDGLPCSVAALRTGGLTVDQTAQIARHVPTEYDESAARVASCCTVRQLRQALPHYADPKPDGERRERREVATGVDEHGWWGRLRLPEAEGAVVDQALTAMHEDLKRQAKAETLEGEEPERVTLADAAVALAETALRAGEAVRPGTDRYLVHVHLQAGLHGPELMAHLGLPLPHGERRLVLCNARLRATLHQGTAPVAMGRATHIVNRRLRRLIEHRDGGCAVPGCHRTTGLDVHHIIHWEDGGVTETWNLLTLCRRHHSLHHQGLLGIAGHADLPRHTGDGVIFSDARGRQMNPVGPSIRPAHPDAPAAARAAGLPRPELLPPTGERLDRLQFHLQRNPPEPPVHSAGGRAADGQDEPPPGVTAPVWDGASRPSGSRGGRSPIEPTRAGPTDS
ncbi:DUF222 domain-containing protein [Aquihabitans sp. McL0605]|uniref:HNH endonuclease signature motif containing protein n=1 Tax=Aquihabitans sp. McL0605 TaxID=3415671 RepID=UPI003CE9549B